ncbi:MAG: SurA N-terminal domain [Chloroflexota bacterium]|jgi:parvulin-like peptidyl-prolyl isomerase|nr:SurA N-terminal domain [Chloroflexota bacterium]
MLAFAVLVAGCSLEDAPVIGKPAATMDGHTISMSDYRQRLKVEQDLYKKTKTAAEEEDVAIRSLVDEVLIDDEAGRKGFAVSDDEVNKEIDVQRATYQRLSTLQRAQHPELPAPPDFNTFLRKEGYDVDRLRESVRHILLEQKVEHKQAQNRADTAYREIQGGATILDTAKKYGDGPAEQTVLNSDLASGDAKLRPTLNTLQPGDTSKVVEGLNGFYIIKLLTRDDKGITAQVVFVNAPAPEVYSPKLRPTWFQDFVKGLENGAHVSYKVGTKAN